VRFESQPLKDKVSSTHQKLNDFISRPHVQSYYNDAVEAMEELKALVPALEVYAADSDAASVLKNAKEKMAKADELIVKAGLSFAAEPLKNKVTEAYRKLDVHPSTQFNLLNLFK
jgi:NADP-dependent 3-hydroxy acid dehydrogenase YdfG